METSIEFLIGNIKTLSQTIEILIGGVQTLTNGVNVQAAEGIETEAKTGGGGSR